MGYGALPHQSKAVDRLVGGFGGAIPRHGIKQLIGGCIIFNFDTRKLNFVIKCVAFCKEANYTCSKRSEKR